MLYLLIPLAALIPAAVAAVFVTAMLTMRKRQEQARQAEMTAFAQANGFEYQAKDEVGLLQQLQEFKLFQKGRSWFRRNEIKNVVRTYQGDTVITMFDYMYVINTGKSSKRITQTVFFAQNNQWFLPNFHLQPETWWHKVMAKISGPDINFPENPDFSDRFWLKSKFDELTRQCFNADIQSFLTSRPPGHMEGNNYYFLAYKPNTTLNAAEAKTFYHNCLHLTEMLGKESKMELLDLAEMKQVVGRKI